MKVRMGLYPPKNAKELTDFDLISEALAGITPLFQKEYDPAAVKQQMDRLKAKPDITRFTKLKSEEGKLTAILNSYCSVSKSVARIIENSATKPDDKARVVALEEIDYRKFTENYPFLKDATAKAKADKSFRLKAIETCPTQP